MNTVMKIYIPLIVLGSSLLIGCSGDELAFGQPSNTTSPNAGVVSQKNMVILADELEPEFHDAASATPGSPNTGLFTKVEVNISVDIGDRNNQLLSDAHTVFFRTQYGLIEPSCVTVNGSCSVKWQSTSVGGPGGVPLFGGVHRNLIVAYTAGEETFGDVNDDGVFDNGDTFSAALETEEPFLDINYDGVHVAGVDLLIDVLPPLNGVHDIPDGFFNGPGCTHTTLCSTTTFVFVWDEISLDLDGGTAHP